jgi:hypothetical protein
VCFARHDDTDPRLGQPLCLDCYDHDHQVVWNLYAGELWRRTKQAIERHLARLAYKRGISPVLVRSASGNLREIPPVRVSHGKVAEFQARGAVHFHALLRLDGVDPDDPDAIVAAPAGITAADLHAAIEHAAKQVAFTTPPHPDRPEGWRITWGPQLVVKHITMRGAGEVTDEMAAAYLAKYATKSTETTGHDHGNDAAQDAAKHRADHQQPRVAHRCIVRRSTRTGDQCQPDDLRPRSRSASPDPPSRLRLCSAASLPAPPKSDPPAAVATSTPTSPSRQRRLINDRYRSPSPIAHGRACPASTRAGRAGAIHRTHRRVRTDPLWPPAIGEDRRPAPHSGNGTR